jgi:glycosyltransferase involved in cell wall biosynthesis
MIIMDAMIESMESTSPAPALCDKPRLAGFLVGDLNTDPAAATKYGFLFRSLAQHYGVKRVFDVSLQGFTHLWNGLQAFHPILRTWKERSYKNTYAFTRHSRIATQIINNLQGNVDMAIQVGVLFNAGLDIGHLPMLIYTDYTTRISTERSYRTSFPWTDDQLAKFIEYEGQAYLRAAHIFTRSNLIRENIVNEYGIPAERVSQVGGGINFDPLPEVPIRASKEGAMLLFIGSNFLRKGGDVLLKAFSIAHRRFPKARLKVLTRDTVRPIYPMDGVEIIPYVWDRERIGRLYTEADLFVLPSRQETWGDVFLEAAAYSLPSIGTFGQAMEEIIDDGKTGLLVNIDNIEQLANAMICLLSDPDLRLSMGFQARKKAVSQYTWDHVVERMVPVIDSVFKDFRSGHSEHR